MPLITCSANAVLYEAFNSVRPAGRAPVVVLRMPTGWPAWARMPWAGQGAVGRLRCSAITDDTVYRIGANLPNSPIAKDADGGDDTHQYRAIAKAAARRASNGCASLRMSRLPTS